MKKYMTQRFSFVGAISVLPHQSGGNFEPTPGQNGLSRPSGADSGHPSRPKKRPKWPPRGSQNGASEKGRDDPEAEGLKREGAKSSKIGTIQKRALNVYGKHILKE